MKQSTQKADAPWAHLSDEELARLAYDAYLWGYPLVVTGEYYRIQLEKGVKPNTMVVGRGLMPDAYAPSMELLYTMSELNLASEPLILSVPRHAGRYYSFQFSDTFANVYAYIGTRATGEGPGEFAIVGPNWQGTVPAGITPVYSPSDEILLTIRTFIANEKDVAAANAIIDTYALCPLSQYASIQKFVPITSPCPLYELYPIIRFKDWGVSYFDRLCERMAREPILPVEREAASRFTQIGIAPGKRPSQSGDARLLTALNDGMERAEKAIETCDFSTKVNGWEVLYGVSARIRDPLLRAFLTRYGCGYHTAEEALYFHCRVGPDGRKLTGANKYRLRFPGLPPANAFWSLNMMDLKMIPVPNPINRFNICGTTDGLHIEPDGALVIPIQNAAPAGSAANWLPAPAGEFFLTMRIYLPTPEAVSGIYKPPIIEVVS